MTKLYLAKPPISFHTRSDRLENELAPMYQFVVHPDKKLRGNVIERMPEYWYIVVTNKNVEVGRGKPRVGLFRGRRRGMITIECGMWCSEILMLTLSRS